MGAWGINKYKHYLKPTFSWVLHSCKICGKRWDARVRCQIFTYYRIKMLIALRPTPAANANWTGKLFSWKIKETLVSRYCHGGVVIDGTLYHITAAHGPQELGPGEWNPDRWRLIDIGGDDVSALAEWQRIKTPPAGWRGAVWKLLKGYDFFSLLAFVAFFVRVSWLNYCFEVCWRMAGQKVTGRVTPEMLFDLALPQFKGANLG